MHNGKDYPYNPEYWATEAWFWPGFVPWKVRGSIPVLQAPPWDQIESGFNAISDPPTTVPDFTQIVWEWTLTPPSTADTLRVSCELDSRWPIPYARWRAVLLLTGIEVAHAILFQDFPQRIFKAENERWWITDNPASARDGPYIDFFPALYNEGGSPYPPGPR